LHYQLSELRFATSASIIQLANPAVPENECPHRRQ
jgi:hypothetical protein